MAHTAESPPIFDNRPLQEMASEIGQDVVHNLLNVFSTDLQQRQNYLQTAISQNNWQSVAAESHALKSSSASCGLMQFSGLMKEIEIAAKTGKNDVVTALAERIDPYTKAAQAALREAQSAFSGV